jgi:hypothetical protein
MKMHNFTVIKSIVSLCSYKVLHVVGEQCSSRNPRYYKRWVIILIYWGGGECKIINNAAEGLVIRMRMILRALLTKVEGKKKDEECRGGHSNKRIYPRQDKKPNSITKAARIRRLIGA